MTITKKCIYLMIFLLTTKFHCVQSAHSSQLTAHSSQLTAHSSQSLVLIKIISCFIIINLSTKRAVSEFGAFSHFILWLLFFYALQVVYRQCFVKQNKSGSLRRLVSLSN